MVDEHQRTTVEGVWALGDVSSDYQLKHVANLEARHGPAQPAAPRRPRRQRPPVRAQRGVHPPQIASVGLTSQEAREQGIEHVRSPTTTPTIAYGWAMESPPGEQFVKLLADPATGSGCSARTSSDRRPACCSSPSSRRMSLGTPIARMARDQYWIHPSMAEVVENALLKLVD